MKKHLFVGTALVLVLAGCHSVYNVTRVTPGEVRREGSIVFVRSPDYKIFGTKSYRDYVEVTHEKSSRNEADLPQVEVGFRNRGGRHWWDLSGPNFALSVKTSFYDQRFDNQEGRTSIPIYETNWQPISLLRGATVEYKAVCPKKEGIYYQVTVSEILK